VERQWSIARPWAGREAVATKLAVSPVIAQILHNRGIEDVESAKAFLDPKLNGLAEPEEYEDLMVGARKIASAIREGQRIVIYCDYDVDGVCGAAILWRIIGQSGGNVGIYIPHRVEEGYGVRTDAINKLADEGTELLITVDCGIRDHEPISVANARGMEVIVTDHHEPDETLPEALAVLHPSRRPEQSEAGSPIGPNPCGATVAFKLAWAVAKELSGGVRVADQFREHLVELTALTALATIADVVPLLAENRILAKFGLEQLSRTKLVGLQALLSAVRLTGNRLASYHVGFVLAPRLNAAGRMGHAREAFELLTVSDRSRADELAQYLDRQNRRRQKLEDRITREAVALAESQDQLVEDVPILVLAKEDWHVGVIGIVASKLVERFNKPVVLIGLDGGRGQGSARSVVGYDINQALDACSEYLLGYGGHAMAGGLRIESGKIIPFMQTLHRHASEHLSDRSSGRVLNIDAEVGPDVLNGEFVHQLQKLAPFGQGNPRPILAGGPVELVGEPRTVGNAGKHLSFNVRWGGRVFRAIAFNQAQCCDALLDTRRCRLAFEPIIDDYLGPNVIQLRVKALEPVK